MPPRYRTTRRPSSPPALRRDALRAVVDRVVTAAGYDLEELTVSRVGRRYLVRVIVDSDQGTSLDAIAEVSRAVSAALDEAEATGGELVPGEYQLEVSSPGVDRPLTEPRHWRRNRGRLVKVRVAGRQLTGRVRDADSAGVLLDVDGTAHRVPYAELGPGRVQVEFSRDPADRDDDDQDDHRDLDEIDGVVDDGNGATTGEGREDEER